MASFIRNSDSVKNCLSLLRPYLQQQAASVSSQCAGSSGSMHALGRLPGRLALGQQQHLSASLISKLGLATAAAAPPAGWRGLLNNYKQLSKAKLSMFVMFSTSAGFALGSGEAIDWTRLAWTSLGTFGAAACANTLNQVYEVANDKLMKRTGHRPLPAGRMGRLHALAFAAVAGSAGLAILETQAGHLPAQLGALNIALYAGVYTPLKQISVANTWVGAVVGAIPPLMGWASATHGSLDPGAYVLAAALFFWQMPHFLSLAWMYREDYARGGFRMLSTVDATGRRTALAAMRHCAYLLPLGLVAASMNVTSSMFAVEGALLAGSMFVPAAMFLSQPSGASARRLFKFSLLYLPLLMGAMVAHRQPNTEPADMEQVQEKAAQLLSDASQGLLAATGMDIAYVYEYTCYILLAALGSTNIKCPSKASADSPDAAEARDAAAAALKQAAVVVVPLSSSPATSSAGKNK